MSKTVFLLSSPIPEREELSSLTDHRAISQFQTEGGWVRVLVIEQKTLGPHSSQGETEITES